MSERMFGVQLSDPVRAPEFVIGDYWTVTKEGGLRVSVREKAASATSPGVIPLAADKVAEWAPGFWTSIKEITNE